MQPEIREMLSEIKAFYARAGNEPEGGGRFRERVAADDPPGWDYQR
jgi:hypothetical protein